MSDEPAGGRPDNLFEAAPGGLRRARPLQQPRLLARAGDIAERALGLLAAAGIAAALMAPPRGRLPHMRPDAGCLPRWGTPRARPHTGLGTVVAGLGLTIAAAALADQAVRGRGRMVERRQ